MERGQERKLERGGIGKRRRVRKASAAHRLRASIARLSDGR